MKYTFCNYLLCGIFEIGLFQNNFQTLPETLTPCPDRKLDFVEFYVWQSRDSPKNEEE